MKLKSVLSVAILSVMAATSAFAINPKWEEPIAAFEKQDKETTPPLHPVVITGSSSARGWNVKKFFPGKPVLNRGFGGSQVSDAIDYFDRLVPNYRPSTLIFYSGDNDIAGGKAPEQILKDYNTFFDLVKKKSPDTRVIILPVKPSPSRWKHWEAMQKVNAELKSIAATNANFVYVETALPLLGEDGKPKESYYKGDKLHMTDDGYKVWTDLVGPHIKYAN